MISVIIPSRNEAKYIEKTLLALKHQRYSKKFEIILADYKSKDKTVKIAEKYTKKIVHARKKGVSAGRNAGAAVANGDILIFIDADTIPADNMLSAMEKAFEDKKVVGATCPIIPISHKIKDFMIFWSLNNYVKATIKAKRPQITGMCFACRKKAFDKVGGFNERIMIAEDMELSKRLGKEGLFKFVDSTFVLTSTRRLSAWKFSKLTNIYFSNYLKAMIFGFTKELEEVR